MRYGAGTSRPRYVHARNQNNKPAIASDECGEEPRVWSWCQPVATWRQRETLEARKTRPKGLRMAEKTMVLAFRRHTLYFSMIASMNRPFFAGG